MVGMALTAGSTRHDRLPVEAMVLQQVLSNVPMADIT